MYDNERLNIFAFLWTSLWKNDYSMLQTFNLLMLMSVLYLVIFCLNKMCTVLTVFLTQFITNPLNKDTPLIPTLSMVSAVSVLMGFACNTVIVIYPWQCLWHKG